MKRNQPQNNITNDWQELEAGEIFDFVRTYAISRDNLINGTNNIKGIGNIHYGDLHATYNSTSINLKKVSVPLVRDSKFEPDLKDLLVDGDLIMADVSEDYDGIGVTVLIDGLEDKRVVGGLHTFVLRDNNNFTDKKYRQYIFRNPIIRKKLQKIANGVSVYGISKSNLSRLILNVPSIEEQKRIVAVLETWDVAIEKLARKIEVKKNIKKGLMQKLLTGKVRLPGFSGKWEILKLGNVCNINRGEMITGDTIVEGNIPVIAGGKECAYYHNSYNYDGKTITVSGSGASAGYINYFNIPIFASDCSVIKNKEDKSDIDFIYYSLKSRQDFIYSLQTGGAQPHIYPRDLSKIKIYVPEIKEQNAIADILTKADQEIDLLEKKLNKFRDQKKYLLNNLITGKIRMLEII